MKVTKISIRSVKRHNKKVGHHFFRPDIMKFHDSRIESGRYLLEGNYFITSEANLETGGEPRRFHIRQYCPKTGIITTITGKHVEKANRSIGAHLKDYEMSSVFETCMVALMFIAEILIGIDNDEYGFFRNINSATAQKGE